MLQLNLLLALFTAGLLTILLPCILPLLPIVLGVSIAGRSKWRPLAVMAGMLVSFVGFTFLLLVVLNQFVTAADYIRISTYYVLLLFGFGLLSSNKNVRLIGVVLGGFFYNKFGWVVVTIVECVGWAVMELGVLAAGKIQQFGADIQQNTTARLGRDNPLGAFVIGLTMGLVWVPCAGPALGFALTLVREQPGLQAFAYLTAYGLGTAIPLLLVGYGGQWAVHSVRALGKYSGKVKQISGAILIFTAVALNYNWFREIEIFLVSKTPFGNLGVDIESTLFGEEMNKDVKDLKDVKDIKETEGAGVSSGGMEKSLLPKLSRAPLNIADLGGQWLNGDPITAEDLKGKVVLVDFWTYSCINCIRTLPYIEGYWKKYGGEHFVLIGVHTPEFVFEKDKGNVAEAIERFELTYPVVQDNDFKIWKSFANRYWPAKYLIDAEGYIRYTHFGEGAYEETDEAIESLLQEIGVQPQAFLGADSDGGGETPGTYRDLTPETYLGSRSWPALGNAQSGPTDEVTTYVAPDAMKLHKYYLVGDWQMMDEERQVLRSSNGEIRMKFLGGEINLVMGLEPFDTAQGDMMPVKAEVWVDGKKTKAVTIDFTTLYQLFKGEYGEHEIILKLMGKGVSGYAFTFGQ